MPQVDSVYTEVSAALRVAQSNIPPVIEALRLLGVRSNTISKTAGVSASMASLWSNGRESIAVTHHPKLVGLLKVAYTEAIRALGEVAAKSNPPELERSLTAYRGRVRCAGQILGELEQHRCSVDTTKRLSVSPRSSTSTESGT